MEKLSRVISKLLLLFFVSSCSAGNAVQRPLAVEKDELYYRTQERAVITGLVKSWAKNGQVSSKFYAGIDGMRIRVYSSFCEAFKLDQPLKAAVECVDKFDYPCDRCIDLSEISVGDTASYVEFVFKTSGLFGHAHLALQNGA